MTWLWTTILGTLLGIVVTALVRPLTDVANKMSDLVWGANKPLYVHIERDQQLIWANTPPWLSFAYAFPGGLPSEPAPSSSFDAWQWAHRNGGVDMGLSMLQVTIHARSDVSVVIEDVLVRTKRTDRTPEAGVLFAAAGGAELDPRRLDVDLDASDPPIVEFRFRPNDDPGPVPALQLAAGQIERFHVWVKADHGWHEWYMHLPLLVNGKRDDHFIGTREKPFILAGWDTPRMTYALDGDAKWAEYGNLAERE